MLKIEIKKEDFHYVEKIGEQAYLLRFSKEDLKDPVYKKDKDGNIEYDENGNPVIVSYEDSQLCRCCEEHFYGELTVDAARKIRLQELEKRDNSTEINQFIYDGKPMWYDKVTRTCIVYSMKTEQDAGKEETVLYDNDNVEHILPIATAIELFGAVEIYAKDCFNCTSAHKAALKSLDNIEEILTYDIKTGYPEKLVFEAE